MNKKGILSLTLLSFIILTAFTLRSNSIDATTGITFTGKKFSEAKATAKKLNKTVFIDGYTEWCGPCKKMAKNVFTQPEVGKYFNSHFVNVKMDMEKADGMLVSRRYNVTFYPTLLFITPEGKLIRKEVGYHDKTKLLNLAKSVVSSQ